MAATHTTNLNLNKPARTDFVSVVSDINDNMDILDGAIGAVPQGETLQGQIDAKADKDNTVLTGSLSLGRKANTTVGTNSFAVGNDVEASGNYSHAEGSALQVSSVTKALQATGDYSHAEGAGTRATGEASHSEGVETVASGIHSHAEGSYTYTAGNYAHSEGRATTARGEASHTEGIGTFAYGDAQHAGGKYNVSDSTSLEIIGNGTGTNARKNARLLDANGNEKLKGDIYVGCNDDSTGGTALGAEISNVKSAIEAAPTEETAQEVLEQEELRTYHEQAFLAELDYLFTNLPSDETAEGIYGELHRTNEFLEMLVRECTERESA